MECFNNVCAHHVSSCIQLSMHGSCGAMWWLWWFGKFMSSCFIHTNLFAQQAVWPSAQASPLTTWFCLPHLSVKSVSGHCHCVSKVFGWTCVSEDECVDGGCVWVSLSHTEEDVLKHQTQLHVEGLPQMPCFHLMSQCWWAAFHWIQEWSK